MYLASSLPCSGGTSPTCDTADRTADGDFAMQLWQQVRTAFPDLSAVSLRIEEGGGDHLLLVADETRVFRFPRPDTHGLDLEIGLLRHIAGQAPVAVPNYDLVDPDGRFASYRLIAGVPLTTDEFADLPLAAARRTIADAVELLKVLHGVDPAAIGPAEAWPSMWSAARFADRLRHARLCLIAQRAPALIAPIQAFLQRYHNDRVPHHVVLHGDLVSEHLLVDQQTGRLAGVIDFSDTALGDSAHDLLGFWAYGASAAAHAVACYDQSDADPTLLARSRDHFIRYEIDRLFEMIVDNAQDGEIEDHAAALAQLLAAPPTPPDTIRR